MSGSVLLLIMVVVVAEASLVLASASLDNYNRTATNQRCGTVIKTASVSSAITCAAICSQESACVGFSLQSLRGSDRVCELANRSNPVHCVPQPNFNFYSTPGVVTTTETTHPAPPTQHTPECGINNLTRVVVGITTDSSCTIVVAYNLTEVALSGTRISKTSNNPCDNNSLVVDFYSSCALSSYWCQQAVLGVNPTKNFTLWAPGNTCQFSDDFRCPDKMAITNIAVTRNTNKLDFIECHQVIGW
ncbi:uncharacterized protein [Procambarus clarkii]|uniref:uncharacterized protein n=1 Tax=Procambarus clarkii TaxID=6728 RepID=UPI00374398A0